MSFMINSEEEKFKLLKKISKKKEGLETGIETDSPTEEQKTDNLKSPRPDLRKLKSIIQEKVIDKEKEKKKKEEEIDDEDEDILDLEFDSYVYLGVVLPDFIIIFYKIMSVMWGKLANKDHTLVQNIVHPVNFIFSRMAKVFLFFVLLIPGLLVPFIQIVVIGSFDKGNLDLDLIDYNKKLLSVAKIFMIFMFSCMALKECSNALKNWLHTIFYMKRLEKVLAILLLIIS